MFSVELDNRERIKKMIYWEAEKGNASVNRQGVKEIRLFAERFFVLKKPQENNMNSRKFSLQEIFTDRTIGCNSDHIDSCQSFASGFE